MLSPTQEALLTQFSAYLEDEGREENSGGKNVGVDIYTLFEKMSALMMQFRTYLEDEKANNDSGEKGERVDLYTLFGEMSTLKNEVRIESRQVKVALDQFRGLVEPLQVANTTLQGEIGRLRDDNRNAERDALRPMLLELLELRDRMASGLEMTLDSQLRKKTKKLFKRAWQKEQEEMLELWREGQEMTLRRLDQTLAAREVYPLEVLELPLNPRLARAVRLEHRKDVADGMVVAELRKGFIWQGELLRVAEVVVNKAKES